MKGFLSFSENIICDGPPATGFNDAMYGIWCPPDCDCGCVSPLYEQLVPDPTPDYGIYPPWWPPIDACC